jgi:hypothetical protein
MTGGVHGMSLAPGSTFVLLIASSDVHGEFTIDGDP